MTNEGGVLTHIEARSTFSNQIKDMQFKDKKLSNIRVKNVVM